MRLVARTPVWTGPCWRFARRGRRGFPCLALAEVFSVSSWSMSETSWALRMLNTKRRPLRLHDWSFPDWPVRWLDAACPSRFSPTRWLLAFRHNRFLVDVSNILTCENGINEVVSGRITDRTGLYAPTLTQRYIFKITFNDSSIIGGEGINFYLQGLMTGTTTDMASKPDGKYAESNSNLMPFAMGEGLWQGTPFVISGSLTGAGRLFPIN